MKKALRDTTECETGRFKNNNNFTATMDFAARILSLQEGIFSVVSVCLSKVWVLCPSPIPKLVGKRTVSLQLKGFLLMLNLVKLDEFKEKKS